MKNLIASMILALAMTAGAHAAPQAQPAPQTSGQSKSLLQILFPPSDNFGKTGSRSNKSPIKRQVVAFNEQYPAGTIIVDTSERRLYHVLGGGKAMRFGIGVGREGFTWQGSNRITRKAEWPGWTPPEVMRRREAKKGRILPAYMAGGEANPLGARALYIGSTMYRIHGTNQPWTIGQAMSSGCIRMANDDVTYLYDQVDVGTRVIVRN